MSIDTPTVAVAIEYGMNEVPVVKAHGTGKLAEMIIDAAREAGVHIHKDEDLVGLLSLLELNDAIPVKAAKPLMLLSEFDILSLFSLQ